MMMMSPLAAFKPRLKPVGMMRRGLSSKRMRESPAAAAETKPRVPSVDMPSATMTSILSSG